VSSRSLSLSLSLSLFLLAPALHAGVISGRVVNQAGVGVASVNLDVVNTSGGGNPSVLNDSTDANGFFTTTVTPDGIYDVIFFPPPGAPLFAQTRHDVVVVGNVNMGTITLPPGVLISGRVLSFLGQALPNVNLDVLDATGANVDLHQDVTDSFGRFTNLNVPSGPIVLRFDPSAVVGQTPAPKAMNLNLTGNTNLGDITLAQGFLVSATVKRTNGTGVLNVDVDVYLAGTHSKLFTPGDNSSSSGFVDFVVPSGNYDVAFCPPFAQHLVASEIVNQAISGVTNLGTIVLQNGVVLSGNVAAFDGAHYANVDVDLFNSPSGVELLLCDDDTDASGNYQVIVPTGTFDIRFSPPYSLPLAADWHTGIVISANKVQNGVLPSCPFYTISGSGTPGTGGIVPTIAASGGAPRLGNLAYTLQLSDGRGGATAVVWWQPSMLRLGPVTGINSFSPPTGFKILTLSGTPGSAGAGTGAVLLGIGFDPALVGQTLVARFYVLDPAASGGKAYSPFLNATICQ
jgi:hypothetical protein